VRQGNGLGQDRCGITVGKRGVAFAAGQATPVREHLRHVRDIVVDATKQLAEGVGIPFAVAGRQRGDVLRLLLEKRRVAEQELVRAIDMPEPELVRPLLVPVDGAASRIDLEPERVLPTGCDA